MGKLPQRLSFAQGMLVSGFDLVLWSTTTLPKATCFTVLYGSDDFLQARSSPPPTPTIPTGTCKQCKRLGSDGLPDGSKLLSSPLALARAHHRLHLDFRR